MKISLSWLKEFIEIKETPSELAELLTQTGLEVDGVYPFESIPGSLEGLVVGKVLSVSQHPNADKLKLTKVDIGSGQDLSIVCGASNVAQGQSVIVAPVGTKVHPKGKDAFVIQSTKIRGELSEGMLCAEDEVGLGDSHDGLKILPETYEKGKPLSHYIAAERDTIIEIGLTPNRGDAASHFGVARDIKAKTGREIKFPLVSQLAEKIDRPVQVEILDGDKCLRYSGVTIRGVKVGPSPDWLKMRLNAIGLTPINNIVDCTNYVLHALGQPLHAFDADKIEGNQIVVKTVAEGTIFTTLDGKERKLNAFDLMICNQRNPMCIAGIFGGLHSGVSNDTTSIFLESAHFSASAVRMSAMRHGLSTDASFRFERGTDIEMTISALKVAIDLILKTAGGYVASPIIDVISKPITRNSIRMKKSTFDRLMGVALSEEAILAILEALDFQVEENSDRSWSVIVPSFRTEVSRPADLVEEVLRIYGINNIPLRDQNAAGFLAEFKQNESYKIQEAVSMVLAGKGFYEIVTNSLTDGKYEQDLQLNKGNQIKVLNPSSEELNVLKANVLYTALESIQFNINRKQTNLKFYEFGKSYYAEGSDFKEKSTLSLYVSGNTHEAHWIEAHNAVAIQNVSQVVVDLLEFMGISQYVVEPIKESDIFTFGLEIVRKGVSLAFVGKLNSRICDYFKIEQAVFSAHCDWELLCDLGNKMTTYKPISKYPEVKRDLSLILDKSVTYDQIKKIADDCAGNLLKRTNVFSIFEGEQIGSDKRAYAISYFLQDDTQTLVDKQIDGVMQRLMSDYENKLGALIRK